jgi:hypothetical protein
MSNAAITAKINRHGTGWRANGRASSVTWADRTDRARLGSGCWDPRNYDARPMGQPITVVEQRSSRPGILRYEINRSLTGMGHERYHAGQVIDGERPVDELARRLFARGGIDAVHVNGSVITVELARGYNGDGLTDVIRDLYLFYRDGEAESGQTTD